MSQIPNGWLIFIEGCLFYPELQQVIDGRWYTGIPNRSLYFYQKDIIVMTYLLSGMKHRVHSHEIT